MFFGIFCRYISLRPATQQPPQPGDPNTSAMRSLSLRFILAFSSEGISIRSNIKKYGGKRRMLCVIIITATMRLLTSSVSKVIQKLLEDLRRQTTEHQIKVYQEVYSGEVIMVKVKWRPLLPRTCFTALSTTRARSLVCLANKSKLASLR